MHEGFPGTTSSGASLVQAEIPKIRFPRRTQPKGESIVKRFYLAVFISIVVLMAASPVYAQTDATSWWPFSTEGTGSHWHYISIGFAMAFAAAICGLAQGRAVSAACESLARNPGAAASIRFALLLGLVLIESLVLYTLPDRLHALLQATRDSPTPSRCYGKSPAACRDSGRRLVFNRSQLPGRLPGRFAPPIRRRFASLGSGRPKTIN